MKNSYSIKDIIALFWSHIILIVFITVMGGAAAFSYSKFVLPLQYSSHITMYVQSYTGISESAETNQRNNISNSKQLVNTYMEVLKDDAVMTAVGDVLITQFDEGVIKENFAYSNGKISPGSIRACIVVRTVSDTSAIKVTATTKNAEVAAAICNDISEVAPEYVGKAVGVGSINTIDQAKVYNTPVAPNKTKNAIMGAFAAFFLVCLIIFAIDFFDNTVKDVDALGKEFKKPIIGEVQQVGTDKKKKNQE